MKIPTNNPEQRLNELNRQYKAAAMSGYKADELRWLREAIRKVENEVIRKATTY